ncbi:MAG TPA: hypothetical protein VGA02_12350 [Gemmatimonadales bacterium]
MAVDVAAPALAPAARDGLGPLTRRASLNAAASLLDYGAKIVVGLVVTPILVSGLGRSLFGVWEMLGRLGSYMGATDGRPTEALRLIVAQRQGHADDAAKRRYVGAALVVWALVLPLVLAGAAVLVWLAPTLTHASADLRGPVRVTCALLVASFLLGGMAGVPESVFRGMNLGYKGMGVQAALNLLGGALAVAAVWTGLGLTGLGGAAVIRAAVTGLCFLLLARAWVRWLGVARPALREVKTLFGMSVWLSAGDVVAKLLLASDVVILGAVVAPALVTTYVLTGYAARTAVGIHVFAAGAAIPGLGGVLGAGQYDRAARARRELVLFTWLFVTAVGATVLLWNRSFLGLWVGAGHYAGTWVNLLIVLLAVQTAFIRVDAYVLDAALRPRQRVLIGAVAAVLGLSLGIVLTRLFGIVGLCVAMLAARGVQTVAYPLLARASLGPAAGSGDAGAGGLRLAAVTAALLGSAALMGERVLVTNWLTWIAGVGASLALVAGLAVVAGPTGEGRRAIARRFRTLLARGRGA